MGFRLLEKYRSMADLMDDARHDIVTGITLPAQIGMGQPAESLIDGARGKLSHQSSLGSITVHGPGKTRQ